MAEWTDCRRGMTKGLMGKRERWSDWKGAEGRTDGEGGKRMRTRKGLREGLMGKIEW